MSYTQTGYFSGCVEVYIKIKIFQICSIDHYHVASILVMFLVSNNEC